MCLERIRRDWGDCDLNMGPTSENYKKLFRLRSLTVLEHPILGNLSIDFCLYDGVPHGIHTSVIIGANGIGKSHLLNVISEIFCFLGNRYSGKDQEVPSYYFKIKYCAKWVEYEFSNFADYNPAGRSKYTSLYFKKAGERVNIGMMELPWRVIVSSTTINDKFVAKSTDMYRYKGMRNEKSPSSTGTRTMVRKTVESLLNSLDVEVGFRSQLKDLLHHLGLQPRLELTYSLRYKNIFLKEGIDRVKIQHIFEEQLETFKKRTTLLWGTQNYEKIKYEQIEQLDEIAHFYQTIRNNKAFTKKETLYYDLLDEECNVHEDRNALKILSSLDLVSYPSLKVYKDSDFLFDQSSSGEWSLFCQMVSIMSEIQPGSIVLIDEPENSAHPNWQINYIGWLKKIFEHYYNCHFIIATHSHFMLSDLEPHTSDIIALDRSETGLRNIAEGVNTFCWSVDDILYRVFHVRNTRNYVFEKKMFELFDLLEHKEENRSSIKMLAEELKSYRLNDDDPLNILLRKADYA